VLGGAAVALGVLADLGLVVEAGGVLGQDLVRVLAGLEVAAPALHELATGYTSSRYDSWFTLAELYEKRLKLDDQARMAYAQVPSTSPRYPEAQKRLSHR
jgi:hypothetical protein